MKTAPLARMRSLRLLPLAAAALLFAPAARAQISLEFEEWVVSALGAGTYTTNQTGTVDVGTFAQGTPESAVLDGIDDVKITLEFFTSGAAACQLNVVAPDQIGMNSSTSGASLGDYCFFNLKVEFLNFEVENADIADFSMSSSNGDVVEYEFGISEVLTEAGPQIDAATIQTYDATGYTASAGDESGMMHNTLFGGGQDGAAFYTGQTVTATDGDLTNGPADHTGGIGVTNANQHWNTDSTGPDYWSYFPDAATRDAAPPARGFSFFYGIFDVNPNSTSANPGGSFGDVSTPVTTTYVPEPAAPALAALSLAALALRRRRR